MNAGMNWDHSWLSTLGFVQCGKKKSINIKYTPNPPPLLFLLYTLCRKSVVRSRFAYSHSWLRQYVETGGKEHKVKHRAIYTQSHTLCRGRQGYISHSYMNESPLLLLTSREMRQRKFERGWGGMVRSVFFILLCVVLRHFPMLF